MKFIQYSTVPLTLNGILFFVLKMMSALTSAAFTLVHFGLDFTLEANIMCPNQTDLGPYCLHYRLPVNISNEKSYDWRLKG